MILWTFSLFTVFYLVEVQVVYLVDYLVQWSLDLRKRLANISELTYQVVGLFEDVLSRVIILKGLAILFVTVIPTLQVLDEIVHWNVLDRAGNQHYVLKNLFKCILLSLVVGLL